MLARDGRLLTLTASLLAAVSLLFIAGTLALGSAVPEKPDLEWAYPWALEVEPPAEAERRRRIEAALTGTADSTALALLASPASRAELHEAGSAFRGSASPFEGGRASPEARAAVAVRDVHQSAEGTATLAMVLFGVAAAAGLLSLLRLVMRVVTFVTCSLLVLGAATGIMGLIVLDASPVWLLAPTALSILGFCGLLVGTNLLPDANHRLVVAAEERLRGLPAARQRTHVITRVLAGVGLAVVAVVATAGSYALAAPGGLYAAYVGALALGLIGSVVPIIAAARVAAGPPAVSGS